MKLQRSKTVFVLPVLLLAALFPAPRASAQIKIAVVDFQEALLATAEMQKAAAELETKFRPRHREIDKLQQEMQEIQQKLQTAEGAAAISLQNDGQRRPRDAQRKSEDLQADVEFERNGVLQKGAEKMRVVVTKLAEQKALDLIVDVSNTLFAKPALNLTQEATAGYNAAHPVAAQ